MRALKSGLIPIVSDANGYEEYITPNKTALVVEGVKKYIHQNMKLGGASIESDNYEKFTLKDWHSFGKKLYKAYQGTFILGNQKDFFLKNINNTMDKAFCGEKFSKSFWSFVYNAFESRENVLQARLDSPVSQGSNLVKLDKGKILSYFSGPTQPMHVSTVGRDRIARLRNLYFLQVEGYGDKIIHWSEYAGYMPVFKNLEDTLNHVLEVSAPQNLLSTAKVKGFLLEKFGRKSVVFQTAKFLYRSSYRPVSVLTSKLNQNNLNEYKGFNFRSFEKGILVIDQSLGPLDLTVEYQKRLIEEAIIFECSTLQQAKIIVLRERENKLKKNIPYEATIPRKGIKYNLIYLNDKYFSSPVDYVVKLPVEKNSKNTNFRFLGPYYLTALIVYLSLEFWAANRYVRIVRKIFKKLYLGVKK